MADGALSISAPAANAAIDELTATGEAFRDAAATPIPRADLGDAVLAAHARLRRRLDGRLGEIDTIGTATVDAIADLLGRTLHADRSGPR